MIIISPTINSAQFYRPCYVTWCKITGQLSRNNRRFALTQKFRLFMCITPYGRRAILFCRVDDGDIKNLVANTYGQFDQHWPFY